MAKIKDLTGQKFTRLTVIERADNRGKQPCWLCKCDCGNTKIIMGSSLRSGKTTSCGCMQKEKTKEKWQNKDFKTQKSEKMKQLWRNEDFRQMSVERVKEQWKDEKFRQIQNEKQKRLWQNDDFKKRHSIRASQFMKSQWQDEDKKWKIGYKGGITPIAKYLRSLDIPKKWCTFCQHEANYTCQLTGKHGCKLNTHHLKAFSTIVLEAHQINNIEVKDQVKDYTQEELKLLEEYVGSWHKDNSNAVVLSEDVHKLFHSLYGKGENTPEQFEEFRERYITGEFKEILNKEV